MGECVILLQFEKADESSDGDHTCHLFSLEKAVGHLKTNFITPR